MNTNVYIKVRKLKSALDSNDAEIDFSLRVIQVNKVQI